MTTKIECIQKCRETSESLIVCLWKCLRKGGETPPPVPVSLLSIVRQATGCSRIEIPDRHMDLPTDADMKRWLATDKTDKKKYTGEGWNCDDYARNVWNNVRNMALAEGKNIAFAFLWTSAHALNLYVNNNHQVIYIEPQTDKKTSIHSKPRFVIF